MDHDRFDIIAKLTVIALSFGPALVRLVMQPPLGSPLDIFLGVWFFAVILGIPLLIVVVMFISLLFS